MLKIALPSILEAQSPLAQPNLTPQLFFCVQETAYSSDSTARVREDLRGSGRRGDGVIER